MEAEMSEPHPFVQYLEKLRDDRGALAALRRGLASPPGAEPQMYRYIVPWLPADPPPWVENAYYLVAALYASHPLPGGSGNLGSSYAQARAREGDATAIERRFTALLAAHPDDLPFFLRQSVSYLRSKEVPIEWSQLLRDVSNWGHPEYGERVRKEWARRFWGRRKEEPSE
jgi:CRISPR system Cascade subunit CasB